MTLTDPTGSNDLAYHVLDVFTESPFAGNPLAVVLDGDDLSAAQMQTLAREFQLSETAFPLRAADEERERGVDYRLRIFTPVTELPFAGHPSVGTAWLLAQLGRLRPGRAVQLCQAGELPLTVGAGGGPVELTGGEPSCSDPVDPGPALAAVGLTGDDLADRDRQPVRVCGTGLGYAVVSVHPQALARCVPAPARLGAFAHAISDASGIFLASWDPATKAARARMFAGDLGVPEDAATGSAALAYGVWLAAVGLVGANGTDGTVAYTIRQGIEMGRPSLLTCRVEVSAGRATRVHVAGDVVPISQGRVRVPAQDDAG